MNLRPLQRRFACCWDNNLFDKLNIFGLVIVSFSLTSVICSSCYLFCKFYFRYCFFFNLLLLIVFLFSWFLGIFLLSCFFFFISLKDIMSHLCDFEFPLKNQFLSASIGSSVASLIAVVVSVSNDVNIGNNQSFVILSLSEEDVISLLVSSLLFLLHNLKTCLWIRFSWTWFQIFMLL